jgi:hypothetical protein
MSIIPFCGPTYAGRSINIDASRCVNWFPELDPDPNAKYPISLVGTAGTLLATNIGTGTIRLLYSFGGKLLVVTGNTLFVGATVATLVSVGTLLTTVGYISASDNGVAANGLGGNQVMLVDGVAGYIYNIITNTLVQVSSITGVQATATLTLSTGTVASAVLNINGGTAQIPPTVTATGGGGTGATFQANLGQGIASITLLSPTPTGVPEAGVSIVITDPTGFGATATPTITTGGILTGVVMTAQGEAYTAPVITAVGVPGAILTAVLNGVFNTASITVLTGGINYTSAPSLTFSGGLAPFVPTTISSTGSVVTITYPNINIAPGDTIIAAGSSNPQYNAVNVPVTYIGLNSISYPSTAYTFVPIGISGTGSTVTVTYPAHGLDTGDTIAASGSSTVGYNTTTAVITRLTANTFTYPGTGIGTPTSFPLIQEIAAVTPATKPTITRGSTLRLPPAANAVLAPFDILGIVVTNGGAGYIDPPIVTITGGVPSNFVPTAISGTGGANGMVTATFANHGMTTGDLINAVGSSTVGYNLAVATAVTVIDLNTFSYPGSGAGTPTVFPTITDTTSATIVTTTTVVGTAVTSITFTGGQGYTTIPTISISAPEGVAFPPVPTQVEYLDGYFIVVNNSLRFYVSELYNGLLWNALASAAIASSNDNVQAVVTSNQQLYFICSYNTEVWADSGVATSVGSPFSRVSGAVFPFGTVAGFSAVNGSSSIFFLGTQRTQEGGNFVGVMEMNGYTPQVVSPPSINYLLSQMGDLSTAIAYTRVQEGHTFYVLSIPNGNSTLVYDSTTQMWHEWSWYSDDPYQINRHISQVYVIFNGVEYVGSYIDNSIYALSSSYYSDNGNPIASVRTSPHVTDTQSRRHMFFPNLFLDMQTGASLTVPNPTATLSWSNDSGHTWSSEYPASIGAGGNYGTRVIWRRLGRSRDRVYRLMVSDPIQKILIAAYMGGNI